jgi:hypothetical protein
LNISLTDCSKYINIQYNTTKLYLNIYEPLHLKDFDIFINHLQHESQHQCILSLQNTTICYQKNSLKIHYNNFDNGINFNININVNKNILINDLQKITN